LVFEVHEMKVVAKHHSLVCT